MRHIPQNGGSRQARRVEAFLSKNPQAVSDALTMWQWYRSQRQSEGRPLGDLSKLTERERWEMSRDMLRRLGQADPGPLPDWWPA